MDLSLYRIKVLLPADPTLFDRGLGPPAVLRRMIMERPSAPAWKRQVWHIGNIEPIDDAGLYFALGRTARSTRPILDSASGNFVETEFDHAPYTHVIVDIPSEVCAIAKKSELAPTADALGRRLERVLATTRIAGELGATVQVSVLSDPERFLDQLREAYAIRAFSFTFTPPNAFDVDDDIVRPLERFTREAGAESGSTTVKGDDLVIDTLEQVTRSAAATGDSASARIQFAAGRRPVTRSLKGDTAAIYQTDLETQEARGSALAKLRAEYRRIRGRGNG